MAAGGDAVMYADGTINTSDMRFKENIKECDLGLDFINKINPVKYNFKEDSNTKYGIIAQEVLKALEDTGIKESSFIATDNPDKLGADYVSKDNVVSVLSVKDSDGNITTESQKAYTVLEKKTYNPDTGAESTVEERMSLAELEQEKVELTAEKTKIQAELTEVGKMITAIKKV